MLLDDVAGVLMLDGRQPDENTLRAMLTAMDSGNRTSAIWCDGPVALAKLNYDAKEVGFGGIYRDTDNNLIVSKGSPEGVATSAQSANSKGCDATILGAYSASHHLSTFDHITGPFSGGLWDAFQQELICFRDHLGCCPFYYHYVTNRHFVFATRIAGVLSFLQTPPRLDEACLRDFFINESADRDRTFFLDIKRLPPGFIAIVNLSGVQLRRFWHPEKLDEITLANDSEYSESYRDILTRAVKRCLVGNGPFGILLSGGIDSSSVASLASETLAASSARLNSFTIVYGEIEGERRFAKAVIQEKNLNPRFIQANDVSFLRHIDALTISLEEPFENPGLGIGWAATETARESGIVTLLDGTPGDTILSYDLKFLEELVRNWRLIAGLREAVLITRRMYGEALSVLPLLRERLCPEILRCIPLFGRPDAASRRRATACVHPDFAARVGLDEQTQPFSSSDPVDLSLRESHVAEVRSALVMRSLEVRHKLSCAFQLESRQPFADRELVEFCIQLPVTQRIRHGWNRYILRKALVGHLPEPVRVRGDKWTGSMLGAQRFVSDLKGELREHLIAAADSVDGLVSRSEVLEAIQRLSSNPTNPTFEDVRALWIPLVLSRWIDKFGVRI